MTNSIPTFCVDTTAVTARTSEVPEASFTDGANVAASNACGIGVNIDGGAVVGTPEQFTLSDQFEATRTPQTSQILGADAVAIKAGVPSVDGDGSVPVAGGEATLANLATGWVSAE